LFDDDEVAQVSPRKVGAPCQGSDKPMKIIHNISLNFGAQERKLFSEAGVIVDEGLSTFRIAEDDPRWARIHPLVGHFRALDVSWTRFAAAELNIAAFIALVPTWHHGYPQPDWDFEYQRVTYDDSKLCEACGTGLRQVAPFRFSRPPV